MKIDLIIIYIFVISLKDIKSDYHMRITYRLLKSICIFCRMQDKKKLNCKLLYILKTNIIYINLIFLINKFSSN